MTPQALDTQDLKGSIIIVGLLRGWWEIFDKRRKDIVHGDQGPTGAKNKKHNG